MLELSLLHDIVIHRIFQQKKNYKAVDGSRSPEPMNVTFRSFNRGTQKWGQRNGKKNYFLGSAEDLSLDTPPILIEKKIGEAQHPSLDQSMH